MEITYKRDPNISHMIVEVPKKYEGYELRMISENDIPCLLHFAGSDTPEGFSYWYDITAKKSLKSFFLQEGINASTIISCLKGISLALETVKKYLLSAENILLTPETIFLKYDGFLWNTYFAYVPGYEGDFERDILTIGEYLIQNVDHEDEAAVKISYGIFEKLNRRDFSLNEIIKEFEQGDILIKNSLKKDPPVLASNYLDPEEYKEETNGSYIKEEPLVDSQDVPDIYESLLFDEPGEVGFESKPKKKPRKNPSKKKTQREKSSLMDVFSKKAREKKKEYFPEPKELEDFIMDPIVENSSPEVFATTLLSPGDNPMHRRLAYEGRGVHKDMVINKTPFLIGSKKETNDGVISEGVISRAHARVTIIGEDFFIEDLESKNGTFLNGQILDFNKQAKLNIGDRISFANIGYRFC